MRYPRIVISLHWISAVLILILWPLGKIMGGRESIEDAGLYTGHIWIGLVVCVLTIVRVAVHFATSAPPELPMPRWERILFVANHWLLYSLLALLSMSGIAMLVLASILPMPGDSYKPTMFENLAEGPSEVHETFSTLFLFMLIMHVGGVVYYQWQHGRTLRRMGVPVGDPLQPT